MSKTNFVSVIVIIGTGIIAFILQGFMFADLRFNLQNVYLFLTAVTVFIYIGLALLSQMEKFKDQIGFFYLGTIFLKMVLFAAIFQDSIMSISEMTNNEAMSLLFPIFVFLFLEVYFIAKILNRSSQKT